jgi:hypothetical protein
MIEFNFPDPEEEEVKPEYRYYYDNDTGPNDDYYISYYTITNPKGDTIGKIDDEEDAKLIVKLLNEHYNSQIK